MSFKREGNDDKWLRMLQKRRVAELLSEDIPEDEACIVKNGRLACLVCSHRPNFDTSEMLSIHRNGKKHLGYLHIFNENKRELEELKARRWIETHGEQYLPLLSSSASKSCTTNSLHSKQSYNPSSKKRLKPNERKTVLQIDNIATETLGTNVTELKDLPGHIPSSLEKAHLAKKKSGQLNRNNGFTERIAEQVSCTSNNPRQQIPQTISAYIKQTKAQQMRLDVLPYIQKGAPNVSVQVTKSASNMVVSGEVPSASQSACEEVTDKERRNKRKKITEVPVDVDQDSWKRKQLYLKATSAGWKLDWTGQKWIKDSDVEFDSDEEPPELPI